MALCGLLLCAVCWSLGSEHRGRRPHETPADTEPRRSVDADPQRSHGGRGLSRCVHLQLDEHLLGLLDHQRLRVRLAVVPHLPALDAGPLRARRRTQPLVLLHLRPPESVAGLRTLCVQSALGPAVRPTRRSDLASVHRCRVLPLVLWHRDRVPHCRIDPLRGHSAVPRETTTGRAIRSTGHRILQYLVHDYRERGRRLVLFMCTTTWFR